MGIMAHRILVPVDSSERSDDALEYVFSRHADEAVTAIHVLDPTELTTYDDMAMGNFETIQAQRREEAEQLLEDVQDRAATHDIEISTELATGTPAQTIVEYADEHGVDHIVIGSHGRSGASRILLGSVAETVVRRSHVPVTVVR